jgi:zinc protease
VQADRTADAVKEILGELRAYTGSKPATAEEIERVKNLAVRALPGRYETAASALGALTAIVQYGFADDYVRTLKTRLEQQREADIRALAKELIQPERITWVIVGDLRQIEQPVRKLGLGEVKILDADGQEAAPR